MLSLQGRRRNYFQHHFHQELFLIIIHYASAMYSYIPSSGTFAFFEVETAQYQLFDIYCHVHAITSSISEPILSKHT